VLRFASEIATRRVLPAMLALAAMAALAAYAVPRGFEAGALIAIRNDPAAIAERALSQKFDTALAQREIAAALAANDVDLAQSFIDLAAAREVKIDPVLADKVRTATAETESAHFQAVSFARGLITGVPNDLSGLAGTALGDLFAFGDIRDAAREGTHWALGEPADKLVLGLSCVGIAITAGTYATLGAAAPVRAGLTVPKVASRTGRVSADLALSMGRLLRQTVDWSRLRRAIVGGSLAKPALAVHTAREAVKVESAGGIMHFVRDVGRVESNAGAQAAFDSLKVAQSPAELSRVAKLAEKEGSKTRAIITLLGRGAIALSVASFDLAMWILGALLTVFGFVSSLKRTTERITLRVLRHRKERRLAALGPQGQQVISVM